MPSIRKGVGMLRRGSQVNCRNPKAWPASVIVALAPVCWITSAAPGWAQRAPDDTAAEILIKTTLLTFNDANLTGNYEVMAARGSKQFRDQFSVQKLKQAFKEFNDKQINIGPIAAQKPLAMKPVMIDDDGVLSLEGYFDTMPSKVSYTLRFVRSDGDWKLIGMNVDLKK